MEEIRTEREQLVAWLERQIALHNELAEPAHIGGVELKEINAKAENIGVYEPTALRALADATGNPVNIELLDGGYHRYGLWFPYGDITINAYADLKELTREEMAEVIKMMEGKA